MWSSLTPFLSLIPSQKQVLVVLATDCPTVCPLLSTLHSHSLSVGCLDYLNNFLTDLLDISPSFQSILHPEAVMFFIKHKSESFLLWLKTLSLLPNALRLSSHSYPHDGAPAYFSVSSPASDLMTPLVQPHRLFHYHVPFDPCVLLL